MKGVGDMKAKLTIISVILLGLVVAPALGWADIRANLTGYQEVSSVSTDATGKFRAKLDKRADKIRFKLSYSGIETNVRFAHIHFSQRHVNGAIVVWLCDNTGNSPIAVDECPQGAGTVKGMISPDRVTGAPAQGIEAGEFDELVDAINARATYVNVHSDAFPGGEIRGQIRGKLRRGDHDDDDKDDDGDDRY